jgi:hemolysin D
MAAWSELLGRYRRVFSHFWAQRNVLDGRLFNEQEAEFLPAALSLQERPASVTARLTGRLLMALVAIALLWAVLGKIDIIVNATGKVIPSDRTKAIASVDVASVRALHVNEGQAVKAGDLLIVLDTSATDAEHDKATGDETLATLQIARSRAMIAAVDTLRPPKLAPIDSVPASMVREAQRQLDGQYQDFHAKLIRTDDDIARYAGALPIATQQANDYRALAEDHDVSEHAWLEKEHARIELQGQLADARNQRAALIAQTRKEAHDALTDATRLAADSNQDARRAGEHSKLLQLRSPVDGTVQELKVHTVGGVVSAAQPLMLIVPRSDKVEVEAFVENKDIGFVQEAQTAEVKIDAFEYTKYGTVPARVTHVSRDAIEDEKKGLIYSTKVALDRADIDVDGKTMALAPGMTVNVEIKTGTRRVIEYVLSPLVQHQRESLHER